jgi:membrane-bound metal-dependent hydrolase YbcI (DUF457 family)
MFIGHFGVGFAAKKCAPAVSLGTLILAAEFVDFLSPVFGILGLEAVRLLPGSAAFMPFDFYDYPYTHSLATGIGWALLFGLVYFALRRDTRASVVLAAVVVSHWVLDWITHRPDMPLYPGGPKVGLGLWNSVPATVGVEGALFILGVVLYLGATRARDTIGRWLPWSLVAFLALLYVMNVAGPPPKDIRSFEIVAIASWLFVPWGYWIERHRLPR